MNKTEIQARIDALQADFDSKLASLKADLAKCADGIEQEKCWHAVTEDERVVDWHARTKQNVRIADHERPAYMPECRQVTADDVRGVWKGFDGTMSHDEFAKRAHKLGFRMKVTP